jgi:hypothetical protein
MADITITPAGLPFGGTDTVTSTRLNEARNPTAALDAGTIVNADVSATADISGSKLADATVTKAKIENISAPLRVLGRTTAGAGVAEEVTINDEDDMANASAITLATDESIKAYVDSLSQYQMKYSGSTGTLATTTSWADWDLSSFVGSNRALVIIELYDASAVNQVLLKTKGSQVSGGYVTSNVSGWGSSGICLSTADQGGTVQVITDENGFIEVQAYTAATGINYTIQAFQKLA